MVSQKHMFSISGQYFAVVIQSLCQQGIQRKKYFTAFLTAGLTGDDHKTWRKFRGSKPRTKSLRGHLRD